MAEIILRDRLERAGLADRVELASSGISDEELGNPIDPRAARVLRERGYPVPRRRARPITTQDFRAQDVLIPMTYQHERALERIAPPDAHPEVFLYRAFDPAAPHELARRHHDPSALDLSDPWYGGPEDFEVAIDQIESGAPGIVEHLRGLLGA